MSESIHHLRSLETAAAITSFQVKDAISPLDVIAALNAARVSFVLIGTFAHGGWMRKPRATSDVDILPSLRHRRKAVRVLRAAFPRLEADELPDVTRLRDRITKNVAVEVMRPPFLSRVCFKPGNTVWVECDSPGPYRIPSLETAMASKYAAIKSCGHPFHEVYQHVHDFMCMMKATPDFDRQKLASLCKLVHPGGGTGVLEVVRKIVAGEELDFAPLPKVRHG